MKRLLLLLILAVLVSPLSFAQSAEDLFQQATQKERVEGDLQGAIELLERVVDSATDRGLAARALLRIGENYEKLGRDNAADAYQRIVSEFADQETEADVARRRIQTIATSSQIEPTLSELANPGEITSIAIAPTSDFGVSMYGMDMSMDGRHLIFQDARPLQYDLQTQEYKLLDTPGCSYDTVGTLRFSPDGTKMAYSCWFDGIWVVDLNTGESIRAFDGYEHFGLSDSAHVEVEIFDWTKDSSAILAQTATFVPVGLVGYVERESIEQWLLVQADGSGSTRVTSNTEEGYDVAEYNACLMQDDRFIIADYNYYPEESDWHQVLRRVEIATGKETTIFEHEGKVVYLWGCDKSSGTVYYSEQTDDSQTLWSADFSPEGILNSTKFITELASAAWPHPIRQDGNLYYTIRPPKNRMNERVGSLSTDAWTIRMDIPGEPFFTMDWSDDGRYELSLWDATERTMRVRDSKLDEDRRVKLKGNNHAPFPRDWFPNTHELLGNGSVKAAIWNLDGVVLDSADVRALATLDGDREVLTVEFDSLTACLGRYSFRTNATKSLRCIEGVQEERFRRLNATSSRSGKLIEVTYPNQKAQLTTFIMTSAGEIIYKLPEAEWLRSVSFTSDDKYAIVLRNKSLFRVDLQTGESKEMEMDIPQSMLPVFGMILHPDGKQTKTRHLIAGTDPSPLFVINRVAEIPR